jgi:hypothetical protein
LKSFPFNLAKSANIPFQYLKSVGRSFLCHWQTVTVQEDSEQIAAHRAHNPLNVPAFSEEHVKKFENSREKAKKAGKFSRGLNLRTAI